MPITTLSGLVAVALYLVSLTLQGQAIKARAARTKTRGSALITGLAAVIAHSISAWTLIARTDGYHFGVIEISTLIFAVIALLTIASSARRPLGNLIVGVFPLASVVIVLSLVIDSNYPAQPVTAGIASHILLSIVAYSLFTLAAVQAAFLAFQNYQLRHQHAASVIRRFPPLQDMERLLFELIWVAQVLLSLGIIAGFMFVDELGLQGLPHKMFFSVLAWIVFAVLLWGRHQLGWRGTTAIRVTLTGFICLLLGFYGSKFVLEFIL
ncbi:MAG: phosphohydrolase [Gammaproteobacteria bacterium]|nr:phosphohydrolase [Gammaproteobacteria bacterium]|tara:strand:- start:7729 stop:8529 length:801 start_codon:yes stop_codon:yes gene_type:complete